MRISDWSSDVCSSDLHRDERPARRVGAAGEHRQRNAAILRPGQVEEARELDLSLELERQRDGDDPFDDLVEDEGGGGDQQAEAAVGRTWAAHAAVNTVSQRLHKLDRKNKRLNSSH